MSHISNYNNNKGYTEDWIWSSDNNNDKLSLSLSKELVGLKFIKIKTR